MKSKTYFTNKNLVIFLTLFVLIAILIASFKVNSVVFQGDLTYLDLNSSRITGLIFLKNKNLLVSGKEEFKTNLLESNPEIQSIEIYPINSSIMEVKITNKDVCCVIIDKNTNKFLISHEGKVLKKLSREQNYPHEIFLQQEVNVESLLSISSLKKIVEIENVLLDKEIEVAEIKLENDKIEFKTKLGKYLVIDSETNTKNFVERFSSMVNYLEQKNIEYNKMDFRFGNVIVE